MDELACHRCCEVVAGGSGRVLCHLDAPSLRESVVSQVELGVLSSVSRRDGGRNSRGVGGEQCLTRPARVTAA